jgi:hypothetical protein
MVDGMGLQVLLETLYNKSGRKQESLRLLLEPFQWSTDILKDDIDINDMAAYWALSKILFMRGREEQSKIAMFLARTCNIHFATNLLSINGELCVECYGGPGFYDSKMS